MGRKSKYLHRSRQLRSNRASRVSPADGLRWMIQGLQAAPDEFWATALDIDPDLLTDAILNARAGLLLNPTLDPAKPFPFLSVKFYLDGDRFTTLTNGFVTLLDGEATGRHPQVIDWIRSTIPKTRVPIVIVIGIFHHGDLQTSNLVLADMEHYPVPPSKAIRTQSQALAEAGTTHHAWHLRTLRGEAFPLTKAGKSFAIGDIETLAMAHAVTMHRQAGRMPMPAVVKDEVS